ncbi:MAG: PEP-utilizing enzyme [Anaerolineae bacterium]|nr:PEP-utilizing enzyme [Anaerolineae bacterium]
MTYIRWFHEIRAEDVDSVGGKGANLGEMVAAGLPVPPGFCLAASAYRDFVASTGLDQELSSILAQIRPDDPADAGLHAARIRSRIAAQSVPEGIARQVLVAYRRLASELGAVDPSRIPVAVRSSATAEDLPTASFAGQQETYLNVRGEAELLERIKDCWASLWTDRAVSYRTLQGFDHQRVYLAVVVQAMIPSEVSGILFTANPVTGNRDEAVINASWGLGEAIVSGLVTPDTFTVHKQDGAITSRQIAAKELAIEYGQDGGTVEKVLAAARRDLPALSDAQVLELATLGQRIEAHYGQPQDVEWAYAQGRFHILQARAITTLPSASEASATEMEYNRTMFIELFPDPLSPAFLAAIQPLLRSMLDFSFTLLGFGRPRGLPAVGAFYNQVYFNRNYIEAAFAPLSPAVRERLVSQIVNPFARHEQGIKGELSRPYLRMLLRMLRFMVTFPARLPGLVARHQAKVVAVSSLNLEDVSDAEIVTTIRSLVFGTARKLLDNDFLMIVVIDITYQMLGTLLERYFGADTESLRSKLISGVTGNVTMEGNKRIWDLAQLAGAQPQVAGLIREYEAPELLAHLQQLPEARPFLEELQRFFGEYGHREIRMDVLYPTWGEDPAPVLGFIRSYLDADPEQSPHRQQARLAKEREEETQLVLARVEKDLAGRLLVSPLLRWVLRHTQANTRERDTMHFELTRLFPPFRRLLLELGRRWSRRGLLDQADDIFFLTLDEMGEIAASPSVVIDTVQARRAEFEANKLRPWPDIIRGGQEIYAADRHVEAAAVEGQLQGVAGSPGVVTGVARIVRGPEEFGRLQKRDILVAPLTTPVWTPLFAIAGGLIAEVGGILSHGSIVAREYGIPAVMSVAGATKSVQEGQVVTIDGNRGIVFLGPGRAVCS